MSKRATNGLTLLSAVVCVLSLMLVGRSFYRADEIRVPIGQKHWCWIYVVDAQLVLGHTPLAGPFRYVSHNAAFFGLELEQSFWRRATGSRWLGIGWGTVRGDKMLILPLWLVPLLTAILPVRWWRKRRRGGGRGFAVDAASAK